MHAAASKTFGRSVAKHDKPVGGAHALAFGQNEERVDLGFDEPIAKLRGAIDILDDDEVIDLIALAWVGRGDFDREEWPNARALAAERHRRHSAAYLLGMPALGDYLEEGLASLGYNCADDEARHL